MRSTARVHAAAGSLALLGILLAWAPAPQEGASVVFVDDGYEITNETVIDRCSRCHAVDDDGRMSRISWLRKTPEGWQTSIRRMIALHGVRVDGEEAREIVRYLSNTQGLAPEELRPALFEVERRMLDHDWDGDSDVEFTCIQCHSMGRVMAQRRTTDEWGLLLDTHRALYPLVDFQAFRYGGAASDQDDPRHPMERAISHLGDVYPLETTEWSSWSATMRSPRLAGTWALSGYEIGKGPLHGTVEITADPNDPDAFTTRARYVFAESGETVERSGQSLVYTGYQWRGRSNPGSDSELREVMFVERDQAEMSGRWFTGAYDEMGPDVTLVRVDGSPVVSGVYPAAIEVGSTQDLHVFGSGLTAADVSDLDFGAGISVIDVGSPDDGALRVRVNVSADADVGARDLFAWNRLVEGALIVHDGVDRIAVVPETGMARNGGANFPKGYQTFEAVGYDDGADGEAGTDDDLLLGRVDVSWHMEEYAATFGDDDVDFVGQLRADGVFDPAADGPNPARSGNRNNIGDVWAVATHRGPGGEELTARAHLIVTVPLYMRWEPWRVSEMDRPPVGDDR